jgi:alpha,alpha-trehalose phosphorylase
VILSDYLVCEPWAVRETTLELSLMAQTESLFALSNGHIGWRANLDEGDPHVTAGSYLNAFFEAVPLPYPETGYGYPEAGQAIVNVTNGKIIRLLVDDEPFDIRYGKLRSHERVLDMKAGVLRRTAEWESPAHRTVRVRTTRLVSLEHRSLAAILYEVEPVDGAADVVLQSELVANEPVAGIDRRDPRSADAVQNPLSPDFAAAEGSRAVLIHSTKRSGLSVAAAMDHAVRGPRDTRTSIEAGGDRARFTVTAHLKPGQRLRLVKLVAYAWSSLRSVPALRSQVEGALAIAAEHGWDGLAAAQRGYLKRFWSRADVQLEGDAEIQQAIRFALFHVLQAAARAEQRAIPAKGLTGPGYDGHTFWDTDTFVLPVLVYTAPEAAADVLRWRYQILDLARGRARDLGFKGAAFPWRTIRGEECSGYWPASTAAFHINADIADAVLRYLSATGDEEFGRAVGTDLLVETARLWASIGFHDGGGAFRINGVTGPDEYSALADNNVYTNLMAQRNLRSAADAVARHKSAARRLKVTAAEVRAWRRAADRMTIPFDKHLGVHEQAGQFTEHERWDFADTAADQYPLFLHFPYFDLYRKQVVKQADLVLAMHLRGDAFTTEQKARNFGYYEELTVRDSSLSSSTQAVIAAEVGHMQLAHDYLGEAALMDLHDLEHNVRDGVHMGSLAGAWQAVVCGLGGMRHHGLALSFAPRLPPRIRRLAFRMTFQDRLIEVAIGRNSATYRLLRGQAIRFDHHGEEVRLTRRSVVTRAIPKLRPPAEPRQPAGRAPARRGVEPPRPLSQARPRERRAPRASLRPRARL